jgi:hypothetical protein
VTKPVRRRTTSPEGLILWESAGPLTVTVERPVHSSREGGYSWHFRVVCACGWTSTLRSSDSMGQLAWAHLDRCETLAEDWRPPRQD